MSSGTGRTSPEAHQLLIRILTAVADARDEDIQSLPPLAKSFDPDALERFVESTTVSTHISLELYDCTVEIDAEGTVTATQTDTTE